MVALLSLYDRLFHIVTFHPFLSSNGTILCDSVLVACRLNYRRMNCWSVLNIRSLDLPLTLFPHLGLLPKFRCSHVVMRLCCTGTVRDVQRLRYSSLLNQSVRSFWSTRAAPAAAPSSPEVYDVVCVGGGPAGLGLLSALRMCYRLPEASTG